jgi:isoprenylcysteine carboxyl methyltransferase (ICMT) family protein YpbQ
MLSLEMRELALSDSKNSHRCGERVLALLEGAMARFKPMNQQPASMPKDRAGVIAPPPLIYLGGLLIGLAVNRWWRPCPIFGTDGWRWSGLALIVAGVALAVAARRALLAAETNINPFKPTTSIVNSGPFGFTRNPLYLALTLIYLGLTLVANTWWCFPLLVPVLLLIHFGVVVREERYLERKFGDSYRDYRLRVRRYL